MRLYGHLGSARDADRLIRPRPRPRFGPIAIPSVSGFLTVAAFLTVAGARPALADEPRRFALFVGSNHGAPGRAPLQHAEADAERLRRVFVELGGIPEADAVLLAGPRATDILATLDALGERITAHPGALLVFYYSGHADDRALLLGDSELPMADLKAALDRVPARMNLHLVDACRSGALTRLKGARTGEPFALALPETGEGRVVITSSTEWEDSQESDRLGGSFFTLHLATGLRGAADDDEDGRVSVAEAYAYVYGRTVESTRATMAGAQHPTYRYSLRGHGDTILTWFDRDDARAARLTLGGGGDWLVVDELNGRVVAELRARPAGDVLALRPGAYRISRRSHDALWEGRVVLPPGARVAADDHLTGAIRYARLVRKGGPEARRLAHAVWVEGGVRGPLRDGIGWAPAVRAAYALALPWLTIRPHVGFAGNLPGAPQRTPRLTLDVREVTFGLDVRRAVDVPWVTLSGGGLVDLLWLSQRARGGAEPARDAIGFVVGAVAAVEARPVAGLALMASGEIDAYTWPRTGATRTPTGSGSLATVLTGRAFFSVGYEF